MVFDNLVKTTPKMVSEATLTLKYATSSYDEKMRARWGDFYDYMVFIQDNTPEDAVIYHPPQIKPWEFEGNQALIRYFLFPRTLVSGSIDLDEYDGPQITHIMIVWGREKSGVDQDVEYGWPKQEIKGKRIMILDDNYDGTSVYSPGDEYFVRKRGVIEL